MNKATQTITITTTTTTKSSSSNTKSSSSSADNDRTLTNLYGALDDVIEYHLSPRPLYQGSLTSQRMDAIDAHARACPSSATKTIADLATYLRSAARGPEERVRAICFWLHLNVSYDTKSYFSNNVRSMNAEDVLRERTSVCHGFARLAAALCKACDIPCEVLTGYAKGISYSANAGTSMPYKSNHNWIAVQLYNPSERTFCWYLIDPTWSAGHVNGTSWVRQWHPEYYMPHPIALAQSHYPEEPKWTLLSAGKRPEWNSFLDTVRVNFPECWELGIVPVTHKRRVIQMPADGRLRMVFRARKGASVFAMVGDGGSHIYPVTLADQDASGAELLAFNFTNLRPSAAGGCATIDIFASSQRYGSHNRVIEYVVRG